MPRWSESQLAMLREMGVHHFWPSAEGGSPAGKSAPAPAPAPAALRPAAEAGARPSTPSVASPAPAPALARPSPDSPSPMQGPLQRPQPQTLRPRPEGVAHMDWPALQEAVQGCQACSLCETRRQPVFGAGHPGARWMLIGEMPGEADEQAGAPFADRGGQLLDRMLDAAGLTRHDAPAERQVYVANVIKCRPPQGRAPTLEEAALCEPFLQRQVALVQPKVIVAMGRFAVQSLLKTSEAIGRLRGQVHDWQGVPLIVTFHPSYLLRNPADKALAWDDLCRARAVIQSSM